MFNTRTSTSTIFSQNLNSNYEKILLQIFTKNLVEIKKLIKKENVNDLLNRDNYTALHYAVMQDDKNIIKYILDCGANPKLKTKENKTALDFATDKNKDYLYEYQSTYQFLNLNNIIDDLNKKNEILYDQNLDLSDENKYLKRTKDELNIKYENLQKDFKEKDKEIVGVKRQRDEAEKAFSNISKKYTDLEKKIKLTK